MQIKHKNSFAYLKWQVNALLSESILQSERGSSDYGKKVFWHAFEPVNVVFAHASKTTCTHTQTHRCMIKWTCVSHGLPTNLRGNILLHQQPTNCTKCLIYFYCTLNHQIVTQWTEHAYICFFSCLLRKNMNMWTWLIFTLNTPKKLSVTNKRYMCTELRATTTVLQLHTGVSLNALQGKCNSLHTSKLNCDFF